MSFGSKRHARVAIGVRASAVFVLVVAMLAVPGTPGEAVTRPQTLYNERPVTAGIVEPGFPIDHVGVVFELSDGADVHHEHDGDAHAGTEGLAVRFRHDGRWGPWQQIIEDGAQGVGQWTGALMPGDDADAYQVRGLPSFAHDARAAALNTTDGPTEIVGYRTPGAAAAVSSCKSRADWLADETIRTSDRSYAPTQIMTVHHTATQNDDPDPDARVRAIYAYHVKTNGWNDIGYQALISEDGTVYEGRWSGSDSPSCATAGGTGWEFGHDGTTADAEMVTAAHTGGYNTGNFGVALLGTLSEAQAKPAARDALVAYLAELADRHGIDPGSQIDYDNGVNPKTVDAISGHRDFAATECPGAGLYDDLPNVRTDVAAAITVDAGPQVTITSPSDADAYTTQETTEGNGAALTFTAAATDDAGLSWEWRADDGSLLATTASFDTTQQVGIRTYTSTATDAAGLTGSDMIKVTVLAADTESGVVDDVTSGETAVTGTVSGNHLDTHVADGTPQTITEVESGGRPSLRHSELEHVWTVEVTGGSTVTLFVEASAAASEDNDGFAFAYSTDGGASYAPALVIPSGGSGVYSAALDDAASGSVHVRVRDTDRTQGARALDSIAVDQVFVRSESTPTAAPDAPTSLTAIAASATVVDLAWDPVTDAWGYQLERGSASDADGTTDTWTPVAEFGADITTSQDTGLAASTLYGYRVRAYTSGGSSTWTSTSVTTHAASGIMLTTTGYKERGSHVVELDWSGATHVDVYRDGGLLDPGVSGSTYTDATGGKGPGQYTHQVCAVNDAGDATGVCSPLVITTLS